MKKPGQALVEVMLGLGLAAALMPAFITSFFAARGGSAQERTRLQATARLREAQEVVRLLKEDSWDHIGSLTGTYHLVPSGTTWTLQAGPDTTLDSSLFTRSLTFGNVYRDSNGLLVDSGTTLDPSVKKVTASVSWDAPQPGSIDTTFYLMRFTNLTYTETTKAQFDLGVQAGTTVTESLGGEVVLGSGGAAHADWCAPSLWSTTYDLSGAASPNAISSVVGTGHNPNQIVAGTGNSANGVTLDHIQVTNPVDQSASPVISPVGSLADPTPRIKTNAVFVSGTHAYITTDTNSKEVVIVDLNTHTISGQFNAPGSGNGSGVYVVGDTGYMSLSSTNKVYAFDLTGFTGDRAAKGNTNLNGVGSRFVIYGNYLFVAESSGNRPLEIYSINNGSSTTIFSLVGYAHADGNHGIPSGETGVDVAVNSNGSRAYLATAQGKVYVFDVTNPSQQPLPSGSLLGTFNTNGMTPKGVGVVNNNKAVVVGTGGTLQYQVIDLTSESNPVLCTNNGTTSGGLAITGGVYGVTTVTEEDGDTFAYIATGDSSAEIQMIQGGAGGGGGTFASSGTFESQVFDAGHSVMFNRFDVTQAVQSGITNLSYQVAITDPPANGTCATATYNYVGPNKTTLAGDVFTGSTSLPLGTGSGYSNPGQCLRYKIYFTTTSTNNSPVFYDITFNYSP